MMTDNKPVTTSTTGDNERRYFAEHRRRPRFRAIEGRRSETSRAGQFALTPRDLDIIAAVARHRFLNSDQITRLFGDGRTRDRLTEIFHARWLERPVGQRHLKIKNGILLPGAIPLVYALSVEGARLLAEAGKLPPAATRRNWTRDNSDATRIYLAHTLAIADWRIALDAAVASRDGLTLRHDRELASTIPRDYKEHPGKPFSMTVPIYQDGIRHDLSVDCDAAAMLDNTLERRRAHFLVEIDLDTMPIVRRKRDGTISLKGTSMMRKFIAYERAHELGLHKTLFDWASFRVVVITPSDTHARNMAAAAATLNDGKGSRLFLFASADATKGDVLVAPFIDCWGNTRTLLT